MIAQEYLIVMPDGEVFSTNWFDSENHFVDGSTVIQLSTGKFTRDGEKWEEVEEDHL